MKYFLFTILISFNSFAQSVKIEDIYSIQVFSSTDLNISKEFGYKFNDYAQPYIVISNVNEEKFYRVYLGVFKSFKEASEMNKILQQDLQIKDSFVRKVITGSN